MLTSFMEGENMKKKLNYNNLFIIFMILPALLYMSAFIVFIIAYLVKSSLTTYVLAQPDISMTLQNFEHLLASEEFKVAFVRTIKFVAIVTPAQLITGLVFAMIINKSFRLRGAVRSIFVIPLALPILVTTTVLIILFNQYGHVNSLLMGQYVFFPFKLISEPIAFMSNEGTSLGLAMFGRIWRDTPISMLVLLAGLQSIDQEQYNAARTMGANGIQRFFYITIPLLLPAISTVLILRSIEAWKAFIFPLIMAPSFPILGVLVDHYYNVLRDPGTASAIGVILILCIVTTIIALKIIVNFVNKFLVKV